MGCRSGDFPPINFTRRHHTSGGGGGGGGGGRVILVYSGPPTGQPGGILSFFTAAMLRRYLKESLEILRGGLRPSTSNN